MYRREVENYGEFGSTLKTIFLSSLGEFDFENHSTFPTLLLIAFILLANIVLLNLLIAILSNTYESVDKISNMEYSMHVYEQYKDRK